VVHYLESRTNTSLVCFLRNQLSPLLWNTLLPVTVIDLLGQQQSNTLSAAVQYALLVPVITAVSGCGHFTGSSDCDAAFDTLTLTGSGFSDTLLLSFFSSYDSSLISVPMRGAQVNSTRLLQPLASLSSFTASAMAGFNGANFGLWLTSTSTGIQSNVVSINFAAAPLNLTGLSGCGNVALDGVQLSECFATDTITITGDNFYTPITVSVAGGACLPTLVTPTSLVCTLDVPEGYTPHPSHRRRR
jgi:hypothetical protein